MPDIESTYKELSDAWLAYDGSAGTAKRVNFALGLLGVAIDSRPPEQAETEQRARRYEYIRTLNPRQYTELWMRNLHGAGPFDDLVDAAMRAAATRTPGA